MSLVRGEQAHAWELRTAWAKGTPVVLSLTLRCEPRRVEGTVSRVAVTGAYAIVDGWHIPCADILGIHRPHYSQLAPA